MDLVSRCALRVAKVVWRPGHGGFAFTVVCKATFELRPDVSPLAAEQEPVALVDVYADEGGGLAVASDLVPFKKRPEVLLTGHAYAPEGRPVPSVLARIVVGEIDKTIQVVGDRHFGRDGKLSDPEYFTGMPLGWEHADGGLGTFNPAGRSLGSAARPDALGRVLAPNLLPVGLRLTSRSDIVSPVGFGPIAPMWPSRMACLQRHAIGWDPGRWHERPLPGDIDLGYFNAAPSDQQRALPFGEEVIYLENLHPRFAQLATRLAQVTPVATVDHGAGPQALQLRCDTLVIDTDSGLAMLVWRGHVLLDHPDRPGRVVVTGPAAAKGAIPTWAIKAATNVLDAEATLVPGGLVQMAAVLPFLAAAAQAAPQPAPSLVTTGATARPRDEDVGGMTVTAGFALPAPALPFFAPQGESVPRREGPVVESASALPFISASGNDEGDGPATARKSDSLDAMLLQMAGAPVAASWDTGLLETLPPPAQASPWGASAGLLLETLSPAPPAPATPWGVLPGLLAGRVPEFTLPPLPASETPVPPPLIGPIAASAEVTRVRDSDAPVGVEADPEPEVEIAFDLYPPPRCGTLAARLACANGDEGKAGEILRAEDLDAGRWERVHAHWLDRINDEAARGRKKLLSEYDGAYVGALEGERGAVVLEEYARLAEAAERGAVAGALADGGLPEGAWPHIHRVWIGRMVKDVRLGKQVRGAIDARRAAE